MLVWVASYPRSGNTLTMLALRDVFGLTTIGAVFHTGLTARWDNATKNDGSSEFEEFRGLDLDECCEALEAHPATWFIKTHRPDLAANPARALCLVRDGRDSLVSHAHFVVGRHAQLEKLPFDERLDHLITIGSGVGTWSESVRAWRTRSAPVELLRFEQLIEDPARTISAACARLGVDLPDPVGRLEPFESLHRRRPDSFRRGVTGAWRDEMSPRLESRFWRAHHPQMRALGYAR